MAAGANCLCPCELKMPSWRTIYRWIYEKYLVNGNLKVLRRKEKSHGVKEKRGANTARESRSANAASRYTAARTTDIGKRIQW